MKQLNKPTKHKNGVGHPPFEPTDEQRGWVSAMIGLRMTWDEVAALIINPRTKAPISKETLGKHFKYELDTGKQQMSSLIRSRYLERLQAGEWNAISFGLRHICGFTEDNAASLRLSQDGPDGINRTLVLEFVLPNKHEANGG